MVVIEHNLELVKTADWVVDLGPGAGARGGEVVGMGRPEDLAHVPESFTGAFLTPLLQTRKGDGRREGSGATDPPDSGA